MRWLSGYNTCNARPETQVQSPEPCKGEKTGLTLQSCLTWTCSYSVHVPIHTIIRKKFAKRKGEKKREKKRRSGGAFWRQIFVFSSSNLEMPSKTCYGQSEIVCASVCVYLYTCTYVCVYVHMYMCVYRAYM